MHLVSEKNIAKISFLYALIVVTAMTLSTGGMFIFNKFNTLNNDLREIEQNLINEQKRQLKTDITALIGRIDSSRAGFRQMLEQQLEGRVEEAVNIAENLRHHSPISHDNDQIKKTIKEALRPIRFNKGQSYFFILTLDGTSILHPIAPDQEGSNLLQSSKGYVSTAVQRFIDIAVNRQSGYSHYFWPKPGESTDSLYEKISYITFYEPLQWILGTGEYVDNLDSLAKETITQDLRNNLRGNTSDYFFVYKLHNINGGSNFATMLINSNRKDLVGKKLSDDYVDAHGKAFRKEFLKGIRDNGEAFVVYWYKKPNGSEVGRKLAFFKLYPEWDWVVARGIYFDRIDAVLANKKANLSSRVKKDILLLCLIFVVAVTFALFVAYHYSRELQNIFDRYKRTQQQHNIALEELNASLKKQSRTDALTGVFNRGHFNHKLSIETSRATRYGTPLCAILLDIDRFKNINDTFGHLTGDEVLKSLSSLISKNIRKTDILARWGGEEFAILAPGISLDKACMFAEKLRMAVESHNFTIDRSVTCSFGITLFHPPEENSTFLGRADENLYQAKNQGRNMCINDQ